MEYLFLSLKIAGIVALGFILYFFLKKSIELLSKREKLPPRWYNFLGGFIKWIIIIFILFLVLHQFGIATDNIWTTLSAVLVLVAIGFVAVWSTLSNILCAFLLIIFAPFEIGDDVEIVELSGDGIGGEVVSINILYTTLEKEIDGVRKTIQIPNNLFFQKVIRKSEGAVTHSLKDEMFDQAKKVK